MKDTIIKKYEEETKTLLEEASYFAKEPRWGRNYEDWDEDPVTHW